MLLPGICCGLLHFKLLGGGSEILIQGKRGEHNSVMSEGGLITIWVGGGKGIFWGYWIEK